MKIEQQNKELDLVIAKSIYTPRQFYCVYNPLVNAWWNIEWSKN